MNVPAQQVHLWPEHVSSPGSAAGGTGSPALSKLALPAAFARLLASPAGLSVAGPPAEEDENCVLVEPIRNARQQPRLLVTFPPHSAPRVNGEPALCRTVLKVGDAFQWTASWIVHVTVFNRPQLGPPSEAQLGTICPVCRVPFAADARVYTCACGAAYHCELEGTHGLQCVQLRGECLRCRRVIVLEEGYAYSPSED